MNRSAAAPLQDVQPAGAGDINRVRGVSGVLKPLVAAGQNAQPPSFGDGPLSARHHSDVSDIRAWSSTPVQLVDGVRRNALRTSGG